MSDRKLSKDQHGEKTPVSLKNKHLIKRCKGTVNADPQMGLWIKIISGTLKKKSGISPNFLKLNLEGGRREEMMATSSFPPPGEAYVVNWAKFCG